MDAEHNQNKLIALLETASTEWSFAYKLLKVWRPRIQQKELVVSRRVFVGIARFS